MYYSPTVKQEHFFETLLHAQSVCDILIVSTPLQQSSDLLQPIL